MAGLFTLMLLVACCVGCASLAGAQSPSSCDALTFDTGAMKGYENDGVVHFFAVPFAQPPLGELRWQPPKPAQPWSGVRDGGRLSAACMQGKNFYTDLLGQSEDCLYLNVWLPQGQCHANGSLPVMLFFHGGSYVSGTGSFLPVYSGENSVKLRKDAIVVTANYRLGLFGYLGSDALRASDGSTGNFGLQDQRAAMRWVKANAHVLGGDPDRVTIYGESAGAGSVSAHLIAPRSRGLFHSAIIESGPPMAIWTSDTVKHASVRYAALLNKTRCRDPACLRALNASFLEANTPHCDGVISWSPTQDGVELTKPLSEYMAAGEMADVPVIMGSNRDEGTLFIPLDADATDDDYTEYMTQSFGKAAPELLARYPPSRYSATKHATGAFWALSHVWGDAFMSCPTRRSAHWLSKAGRNAYVYFYQHELAALAALDLVETKHAYGCAHATELPLVFHDNVLLLGKGELALSDAVVGLWHTFASAGAPRADGATAWPTFAPGNRTLVLDIAGGEPKLTVDDGTLKSSDCDFWDGFDLPLELISADTCH